MGRLIDLGLDFYIYGLVWIMSVDCLCYGICVLAVGQFVFMVNVYVCVLLINITCAGLLLDKVEPLL